MENRMTPIGVDEKFKFACSPKVSCFNECCRDLNQFLMPYDILKLKNRLRISSKAFIEQYTSRHTGPETGLPVMTLRADPASGFECPFVSLSGCSVYEDRPASCRMYPLARALSRHRETGRKTEHFALIREDHCRGFEEGPEQTVQEWITRQGLSEYNRINDMLMEIIAMKNRLLPERLDIKSAHFFHIALYDLDSFRTQIFENSILSDFQVPAGLLEKIKEDDVALLRLGHRWICHILFMSGFSKFCIFSF